MKNILVLFVLLTILYSCNEDSSPDVSGIEYDLQVKRFEQDFFSIDTNNIIDSYKKLEAQYPNFLNDFNTNILGIPPIHDSNPDVAIAVKKFIADYRPVKDSADKSFSSFDKIHEQVEDGMRHVLHYFPNYKAPKQLITFIGPMDAYYESSVRGHGDVITTDALAVGLQLHMGSNYSLYTSDFGQSLYPRYISNRFNKETIPVNCMINIIDDMFPDRSYSKSLVEQMVEKGKRIYLLDLFLPKMEDSIKLGYTKKQLEGCYENEGLIWNYFLTNSLVYNNDPSIIKNYIGDSPSTQELGQGSPGYIGLFTGWRIVQEYMKKYPDVHPEELMQTDARQLFEQSKYRPR